MNDASNNESDENNLDDENDGEDDGEKGLRRVLNATLALAHKAQPLRII